MARYLSMQQLTLLVVGLILTGGVLILLLYGVHRLFRRQREECGTKLAAQRPADETAFALATMQSVIAGLRARERELKEQLHEAERQAEAAIGALECVVREVPLGLMIINREGLLTLSNAAVRALLGIDTWSRRRYTELLPPQSPLTQYIRDSLETGKRQKCQRVEYSAPDTQTRLLEVSLSPWHDRNGQVAGVICVLAEVGPSQGS